MSRPRPIDNERPRVRPRLPVLALFVWFLPAAAYGQSQVAMPCSDDTYVIDAEPTTPHGSLPQLRVGFNPGPATPPVTQRTLLEFDLSALPAGAEVRSSVLRVYLTSAANSSPLGVYPVLGPWDEATATWTNQPAAAATSASLPTPSTQAGYKDFNVTQLVRDWVSGTQPNHGVSLRHVEARTSSWNFLSRESNQNRPLLSVTYDLPPPSSYNPHGWIQTHGWNFFGPLLNPFGAGAGGVEIMKRNWVCPHDVSREDPKAGTRWQIDFGGCAASPGSGARGIIIDGTWHTLDSIEQTLGLPVGSIPRDDRVNFGDDSADPNARGLWDWINNHVVPTVPGAARLPTDNVLGIATTYVRNNGPARLVDLCTGSDDSCQVWINNKCVLTESAARAFSGGFCQEVSPVLLPSGVSRIAVLVWEGGGSHNFGLSLMTAGSYERLADGNGRIEFLGPGDPATRGQVEYCAELSTQAQGPQSGPVAVTVRGSSPAGFGGRDDDRLTVRLCGKGLSTTVDPRDIWFGDFTVPGWSGECLEPAISPAPVGAFDADVVAGYSCPVDFDACGSENYTVLEIPATATDLGTYTSSAQTGGDIWNDGDLFEFAYMKLSGDFDVAVEVQERSFETDSLDPDPANNRWGKFGLMARVSLDCNSRFTMVADHLPLTNFDDTNRCARRTSDLVGPPTGCMDEDPVSLPGSPPTPWHARFQRLKRTGSVVQGYFSDSPEVLSDPCNDNFWTAECPDDDDYTWCCSPEDPTGHRPCNPPACMYVGFANSLHNTSICGQQVVQFRLLACRSRPNIHCPEAPDPECECNELSWSGTRRQLNQGLGFSVASPRPAVVVLDGVVSRQPGEVPEARIAPLRISFDSSGGCQIPGDCNQDGDLDISDGICLLRYLFEGRPARLPCGDGGSEHASNVTLLDSNGDDGIDLADAVHVILYLFRGGRPPVSGTECIRIPGCAGVCGGSCS